MSNKYKSNSKTGHNGTLNGMKDKKNARRKREQDRQDAREMNPDYTPALRLANLDNLKMTAKKERAKLERLLKA